MSTTDFCPECGANLEPTATACPKCGSAVHGAPAVAGPGGFAGLVDTLKKKPAYWIGGLAVVAIAAFVIFGGALGPSGKQVCTATLTQARDFGVISPSATLDSNTAKSTDVKNRKSCVAKVGDETYTLTADIKNQDGEHKACRDYVKQSGCIALYSVIRSDGTTTYQVHEIPPNDTDEALAKEGLLGMPPGGNGAAAAQAGGDAAQQGGGSMESETAVDNSGSMQTAPATGAAPVAPQGPSDTAQ